MRLDKYLKNSRLVKRRTVANEMCSKGKVKVNDKIAKAGTQVKIGDIIEISFGENTIKVQVTELLENVIKSDSTKMYKLL